ncbi:hypothetical protein [Burkholderia cepacia]|uniref:hypothetical protein n=1 Tax=Burkholderia cepacia TaxID=292 RepID=UPI0012D914B9|nr:hypothetical protein [Burkholderia cepacia]
MEKTGSNGRVLFLIFWLACVETIAIPIYLFCTEWMMPEFSSVNSGGTGIFFASMVSVCAFSAGIVSSWARFFREDTWVEEMPFTALTIHLAIAIFGVFFLSS